MIWRKISFCKIKSFKQRQIDSSSRHQNNCIWFVSLDIHINVSSKRHFVLPLLVKLDVERDQIYWRFNATYRTVYTNVSIETLIIDVFDNESYLFFNNAITTSIKVYLLELTKSLCEISTTFLEESIFVIILFSGDRNGLSCLDNNG